jgi:hypothetical protein
MSAARERLEQAFTITGDLLHELTPVTDEERALFRSVMTDMAKLGEVLERRKDGEERSDG